MKSFIVLISSLILVTLSCSSGSKSQPINSDSSISADVEGNPYLKKYSGAYTAEIKGKSVTAIDGHTETYLFAPNGQFKWMLIGPAGGSEAKIDQEQVGRWTATETKIIITTFTNTQTLTEEFNLVNGVFVDSYSNDRYLKPLDVKR